jgi:hypothetical protein
VTEPVGKAFVTNLSALSTKYGERVSAVQGAIAELIESDTSRGVTSRLIALDDAQTMIAFGAPAVTDAADPMQAKAAVDAVCLALKPAYLMILGAPDVVPHQPMSNPMFAPDGDPDETASGDLPYACEQPYSTDPSTFVGPTRVVGRLPDITGGSNPAYLIGLLRTASAWEPRPKQDYLSCLGISAVEWEGSTTLSLQNLVGSSEGLRLSPTEGPDWPPDVLDRRMHFINCHGAESDSRFYGQQASSYPVAHDAALVTARLTEGTVAAVECCYGAQLFDPRPVGGTFGLCSAYLSSGAYGYFGSSTIAYGPAVGNGSADLICQYFLRHVLEGASLGRAALEARQDFVRVATVLDPADLKTLAQFDLLGDPSIHPVLPDGDAEAVPVDDRQKSVPADALRLLKGRTGRRANLAAVGRAIGRTARVSRSRLDVGGADAKMEQILSAAGLRGLPRRRLLSFAVTALDEAQAKGGVPPRPSAVHVVLGRTDEGSAPGPQILALIAQEIDGRLVSFRRLHAK